MLKQNREFELFFPDELFSFEQNELTESRRP